MGTSYSFSISIISEGFVDISNDIGTRMWWIIYLVYNIYISGGGTNLKPLIISLSMIGKFGITACFGSVFMYAPELFPTTIR